MVFLRTMTGPLTQWINTVRTMYTEPRKIRRKQDNIIRRPTSRIDHFYHYHLYDNQEHVTVLAEDNCTPNDVVAYTDGSRKYVKHYPREIFEHGGIGIYIRHQNIEHSYWHMLGKQSILYNETCPSYT